MTWANKRVESLVSGVITRLHVKEHNYLDYRGSRSGCRSGGVSELAANHGGTITVTGAVPTMRAEWRYAGDANGFQILLAQSRREDFVRSITEALGEPQRRVAYPHLVYTEDRFGVGIVADLQSDPMHIICLRKGSL